MVPLHGPERRTVQLCEYAVNRKPHIETPFETRAGRSKSHLLLHGTEAERQGRLSLLPRLVGRGGEARGAVLGGWRAAAHAEGRAEEDVPDCCGDHVGIVGGEKEEEPRGQSF